ncbi:PucR-like helix-turn-helix protein [Nocardia neocaledoniensis]|uniref:PucR-like helix-turn-helix protein n=2 Tax=Nocardia neocaledoniensis TaxID=236511 RepID=A0A317NID2_9NOCA|nr:helix-turn-helix domain-containing protein [Nocardia neocaledoniensis]PWV75176.1 PucR-like helix-turn-helix protein [Nocardia neocaledoniensis]
MSPRTPSGIAVLQRHDTIAEADVDQLLRVAGYTEPGDRPTARQRQFRRTVARLCLAVIAARRGGLDAEDALRELEQRTLEWAREGLGVDAVLDAVHRCVRAAVGATEVPRPLAAGAVVEVLGRLSGAVAGAYVHYALELTEPTEQARGKLAQHLLAGDPCGLLARDCGVELAARYRVLAVHLEEPPATAADIDERVRLRHAIGLLRREVERHCDGAALAALSARSGTVLLPDTGSAPEPGVVADALTRAAQRAVTVAVVDAAREELPAAAERAHELLAIARRAGRRGAVHQFRDFALEYQLTRPGPAREHLRHLLAPLDDHPELLQTLRIHLATEANRLHTARLLHVHTNTVDYRLRRIATLTGLDAKRCPDLWYLRAGLVVTAVTAPEKARRAPR